MPYSAPEGKHLILQLLTRLDGYFHYREILDVGAGAGGYSALLRSLLPEARWTALEIWEPYLARFSLVELYDNVIVDDVRQWQPPHPYDLVLMGDVLEHMSKDEARDCVYGLLEHTTLLLIVLPLGHHPQEASEGNPYERHVKDDWSDAEARACFPGLSLAFAGDRVGIYLLSSNQGVHEVVKLLFADFIAEISGS